MSELAAESVEDRIFFEQLRMPLRAMQQAVFPGLLLLALLFFAMEAPCNRQLVEFWCAIAALTWIGGALHARHRANSPLDIARAKRLLVEMKFIYAFEGAVWGALPWVTLDSCSITLAALSVIVNAGVAASRMMLLSSVPSIFFLYIGVGGLVWIMRAATFDGLPYAAAGIAGLLYVVTLAFQARVHARTLINSIRLGFENKELLQKLREQIGIAEAASLKAEEASRAKSRFLAAASHDLRQPSQAQSLFLDVLARTPLNEQQRQLIVNLGAAYSASADMLSTLLEFSRIEAGVIEPQCCNFPLQSLLTSVEREFGPLADARNLIFRSRDTHLVAYSDPALVRRILSNLIANALRYTKHGGVLVACRQRRDRIYLEVWDTGIGIAPEHQKAVFSEFLQLGNPERDRTKGLGLGLAIVDGLVRCLDHELVLNSRPGRGSLFRLVLPRGDGDPQPVQVQYQTAALFPSHTARVLVIDDDAAVRLGLSQLFATWHWPCDTAEDIWDAFESIRRHRPDVIISDYRLRGPATGAHAIVALRAELCENTPALLITGDTDPERLLEAQASGILLLHKPVAPAELRRKLNALLNQRS